MSFQNKINKLMQDYVASIPFDQRLYCPGNQMKLHWLLPAVSPTGVCISNQIHRCSFDAGKTLHHNTGGKSVSTSAAR